MRLILNIFDGPAKGQFVVHEANTLTVGRTTGFAVEADRYLSRAHFEVELADGKCLVRDRNSGNGTSLNGTPIIEAECFDGDEIQAGQSSFQVMLELSDDVPSPDGPPPATDHDLSKLTPAKAGLWRVLQLVQPLYTIVDCAIGEEARDFVALCGVPVRSLYEAPKGEELARFAPYLVSLPQKSEALRKLIDKGWGANWGIFFSCPLPFLETRRHLRRFLLVKMANGQTSYFRYYDPRVLRGFLPKLKPEEAKQFFGPIQQFLLADADPETMLRFTQAEGTLKRMEIRLASQARQEQARV